MVPTKEAGSITSWWSIPAWAGKPVRGYSLAEGVEEKSRWLYWMRPQEAFARAYAQYVAWKSGDRRMLDQIDARQALSERRIGLSEWPLDQFLPIAQAMDRLLLKTGWLTPIDAPGERT